jgi:NADH-dependent peroxiredoxin subunit F
MPQCPVCLMFIREEEAISALCEGDTYSFCSTGCRDRFFRERTCTPRTSYELIIIGAGPAGLTAAIYAATLKIEALLIARNLGGQAIDSTKIENYLGFDFITGPELIDRFKHQLIHSHYIDHLISEATKITIEKGGFQVTTSQPGTYSSKTLIVATGMTQRRLNVPGEEQFIRRGIFYGNIQELSFVEGESAAVIGGGNSALQIVENLGSLAKDIHLISTSELSADPLVVARAKCLPNVHIYENYMTLEFIGNKTLDAIVIKPEAGKETMGLPVKGVFIAIGQEPNSSLVADLVRLNQRREIIIQPDCSTSHEGIFAAGDVTNSFGKRIIIAAGEGAKASLAARQFILDLHKKICLP